MTLDRGFYLSQEGQPPVYGDRCRGYGEVADILRNSFVSDEVDARTRVQYIVAGIPSGRGCGLVLTLKLVFQVV